MLVIENLCKSFGKIQAVDHLSLTVKEDEIYALIGPNGAGKTTTIKMIVGLYLPDSGKVEFSKSKKFLSYIPDEPFFYPGLTGWEFLHFSAALHGISKNKESELLEKFSQIFPLGETLDGEPVNYSRGNKQKLAICAAFLSEPKLILIDEPIVGLDPQSAKAALTLFDDFAQKDGSILLSTHTLAVAEKIASRVGIIDHGRLVEEGTVESLRQKAKMRHAHLEEVFLKITQEKE